jgi:hypothetical protein
MSQSAQNHSCRVLEVLIIALDTTLSDEITSLIQNSSTSQYTFTCTSDTRRPRDTKRKEFHDNTIPKCDIIVIAISREFKKDDMPQLRNGAEREKTVIYAPEELREFLQQDWFSEIDTRTHNKDELTNFLITRAQHIQIGNGTWYGRDLTSVPIPSVQSAEIYADILKNVLGNIRRDLATTFAVLSPWGRGKTHLSRLLEQKLGNRCVRFSAWQYRSSFEVWSFLYETLHTAATKSNWLLPFRALLTTHGLFTVGLMQICITLITTPFHQRVTLFQNLLDFLCLSILSSLSIIATLYQTLKMFKKIWSRMQLPRHDMNLGLQHVIGTDLRNLLCAWIPNRLNNPVHPRHWSSYILPGAITVAVIWFSVRMTSETLYLTYYSHDWNVLQYSITLIGLTPCIFSLILMYADMRAPKQDPILLIVDDLDRLSPNMMLQIIESLLLFLDDPQIASRLQVMFLIEEDALQVAFREKYNSLLERKKEASKVTGAENEQMLEKCFYADQMEKHFLFWLRLAPLTSENAPAVVKRVYHSQSIYETVQSKALVEKEMQEICAAFESGSHNTSLHAAWKEWTPRRIETLIYRYQLARDILVQMGIQRSPSQLVRMIAGADTNQNASDDAGRVVSEVV